MKANSTLLSNVVVFAGIATAMLMICLPVVFVQFPIWLALVLGFAIGVPLLVVGFLLHPESAMVAGYEIRELVVSRQGF